MIRTTKYFDSSSNQAALPPTVYRKPVRIVKAVQRAAPSSTSSSMSDIKFAPPTQMNSTHDLPTLSSSSSSAHLNESILTNPEHHLSSEYVRNLFPIPDHNKRNRSRQNSSSNTNNDITITDNGQHTDNLLLNLTKRLETLKENQRTINDEIETNTTLGLKLIDIIESKGESNEIEKFKLHISEIDTITSVLLKLSTRLAKVENDLSIITDDKDQTKASLLDRREKIQQKHDEAKSLKDGIDRRSRLVKNILQKYLTSEQLDDYDHFIRMKSTLLIDAKDIEENIVLIQNQIQTSQNTSASISSTTVNNQPYSSTSTVSILENLQRSNSTTSSASHNIDNIQTNHYNAISTTA
ncbi:unnamed protein product [Adineta steineri]|uniref:ASD2 domain-containing protein n=1 Tax=Adineta steineri TaxID=433720 RepID=A0A818PSJ7_9BILA|nr:unnamed protein product [Adineta steineri]